MKKNVSPSDSSSPDSPSDIDLLEKFTRQLRILSRQAKEGNVELDESLLDTIEDVQETADEILKHFANLKRHIRAEFDESISPLAEEIVESAIADTLKVKQILPEKGMLPHSVFEGSWQEQIARWVRMYSDWKDEKNIGQHVMRALAEKIDLLIEKDLQFLEKYQKQSLIHVASDPKVFETLRDRIQVQLAEPIHKLKALRKQPEVLSLEEIGRWSQAIHKKRSSYMESLLHRIESVIEEESPFSPRQTDEELETEILNECAFLEKEIEHLLLLAPKMQLENAAEITFLSERAQELFDYIEELKSQAQEIPRVVRKIEELENKLRSIQNLD